MLKADFTPAEEWRAVPGYSDYEASTHGRVRSYRLRGGGQRDEPVILRAKSTPRRGYLLVSLASRKGVLKYVSVHRVVAMTFLPPVTKWDAVNHLDGNKLNNRLGNLEVIPAKLNNLHARVMMWVRTLAAVELKKLAYWNGSQECPIGGWDVPKRRPDWIPKLSLYKRTEQGRVRIPGKGDIYLGPSGCWPVSRKNPPPEVVEAYEREISRWMATRGGGIPEGASFSRCTISQLVNAYRKHCEKTYRKRGEPTSHVRLIGRACKEVVNLFGSTLAVDFASADLRAIRAKLEREGNLNRRSINYQLGRIKRMFRWAVEEELVPEDVWLRLKVVGGLQKHRSQAREPGKVKPVSPSLVEATLPELPEVLQAMVQLQQIIGARPEEICYARAGDFTEEDGLLRYDVRDDANKLAHQGIARTIYLGPQAQRIIRPWLLKAKLKGSDEWVFPKRLGKGPQTPRRYWIQIAEACERAGVERWKPGQLRHSAATEIRKRYGLDAAQVVLGHTTVETSQVYAEKNEDLARRVAREIG